MLKSILPKEVKFFDLFEGISKILIQAAEAFCVLLKDLEHREQHVKKIDALEKDADEITHKTIALLHKTFITPLDREQIHSLVSQLDDVLDLINAAAHRIDLYDVRSVPDEVHKLAAIALECTKWIDSMVKNLSNLRHPSEILKNCVEINRLENDSDELLHIAVARLFREENDVKNLIKLKELCELLEEVTDCCEDVANIVEGIVLENA
ncbi:MAG: DUF47 domain-containing protein [Bacteriovoracia bacterium]